MALPLLRAEDSCSPQQLLSHWCCAASVRTQLVPLRHKKYRRVSVAAVNNFLSELFQNEQPGFFTCRFSMKTGAPVCPLHSPSVIKCKITGIWLGLGFFSPSHFSFMFFSLTFWSFLNFGAGKRNYRTVWLCALTEVLTWEEGLKISRKNERQGEKKNIIKIKSSLAIIAVFSRIDNTEIFLWCLDLQRQPHLHFLSKDADVININWILTSLELLTFSVIMGCMIMPKWSLWILLHWLCVNYFPYLLGHRKERQPGSQEQASSLPLSFQERKGCPRLRRKKSLLPEQGPVFFPHHRCWLQMGGALPVGPDLGSLWPRVLLHPTSLPRPEHSEAVSSCFLSAESVICYHLFSKF